MSFKMLKATDTAENVSHEPLSLRSSIKAVSLPLLSSQPNISSKAMVETARHYLKTDPDIREAAEDLLSENEDLDRTYRIIIKYLKAMKLLQQEYHRRVRYRSRAEITDPIQINNCKSNSDLLRSSYRLQCFVNAVPYQKYKDQSYLDFILRYWQNLCRTQEIRLWSKIWEVLAGRPMSSA